VPQRLPQAASAELSDHDELSHVSVTGHDWADSAVKGMRFATVGLLRTSLARAHLLRAAFQDVVGRACDLSASSLDEPTLTRVEFYECTLVGARWSDGRFTDVRFIGCQLDLVSFWAAQSTRVSFERCRLREADFHGANLSGVKFIECDLTSANWAETKLEGTDVSTSDIGGIKVGASSLAGLVVNREQAVELAKVFGLVVL
jgi:uncharacterized protein YjbI with pentapeptide repeats